MKLQPAANIAKRSRRRKAASSAAGAFKTNDVGKTRQWWRVSATGGAETIVRDGQKKTQSATAPTTNRKAGTNLISCSHSIRVVNIFFLSVVNLVNHQPVSPHKKGKKSEAVLLQQKGEHVCNFSSSQRRETNKQKKSATWVFSK